MVQEITITHYVISGLGSSVGIVTGYGLDGPGIEFQWARDFPHLSRPALGPPSLLYNGYRVFPRGKEWPGRDADPTPPSSAVIMKGYSYTSTPPMGCMACTQPQCLYKGALYLLLCNNSEKCSSPLFYLLIILFLWSTSLQFLVK
jgi:hypothetical protein